MKKWISKTQKPTNRGITCNHEVKSTKRMKSILSVAAILDFMTFDCKAMPKYMVRNS